MTRLTRRRWFPAIVVGLSLAGSSVGRPSQSAAQDVAIQGRAAGVEAPLEILRILAEDTTAFQFRRAWKERAAAVRARRAEIESSLGTSYTPSQLAEEGAAVSGVMFVPVVPVQYSDRIARYLPSQYQERLFGSGSGAVAVTELYAEMSGYQFFVSGAVLPWVTLSLPASSYEPAAHDDKYGNVADFLHEALMFADPLIDFGEFDNDGVDGIPNSGDDDGFVDVAAFIYPTAAKVVWWRCDGYLAAQIHLFRDAA